ncbi:hypothetical protein [Streptomyces sp. CRN 30]|uniref:hypothetical protein n=1 Tax=Streptomyces sp. CRN 30 TaxID=3075613 RepID=UPI002A839E59|nr:hypothetical protein [Streptomyces sp. CRN 30]
MTAHPPAPAPATLAGARRALDAGRAVVLPNPAPLTHVVTAAVAPAVNEAKGRPAGQPVALWAHHPGTLADLDPLWDLSSADRELARRLLSEEHLTVLLPLRPDTARPSWARPAVKNGWMLLFGARWEPVRPLLDDRPVLYVSSANRTGGPPAATAAEALAAFPPTVPVLADPHPVPSAGPRRATTTVRLYGDGRLTLHRHGAQDASYDDPDDYLGALRVRYVTGPR